MRSSARLPNPTQSELEEPNPHWVLAACGLGLIRPHGRPLLKSDQPHFRDNKR